MRGGHDNVALGTVCGIVAAYEMKARQMQKGRSTVEVFDIKLG